MASACGTGWRSLHKLGSRVIGCLSLRFQSSRYINFEEHIGSFGGEVTAIPADAAGPGATTNTVASLLTTPASEISTVMDSGADPEERQRLFDRWVGGLALSLIHISEPTRLRRISYAVFCLKKK